MADRIKYTQLVDLVVKSGKVDATELEREFPRLVQQLFASLPAAKAVVPANVKVKSKLDTSEVIKDINDLMEHPSIKNLKGTQEYDRLEKVVTKYARALEHLANVTSNVKFKTKDLAAFQKIIQGDMDVNRLNTNQQKQLRVYRNYLSELQKVFGQVQREVTRINDLQSSSEVRNASRRLISAQRAKSQLEDKLSSPGLTGTNLEKLQRELAKKEAKIAEEYNNLTALRSTDSRRNIGAYIGQEFFTTSSNLTDAVKKIDSLFRSLTPERINAQLRQAEKAYSSVESENKLFQKFENLFRGKTSPDDMLGVYKSLNSRQKAEATRLAKEVYEIARREGRDESALDRYFEASKLGIAARATTADRQRGIIEAFRAEERNNRNIAASNKAYAGVERENNLFQRFEELFRGKSSQEDLLGVYKTLNTRQKAEATRLAKEVYEIARREGRDEQTLDRYYGASVLGRAAKAKSAERQQDIIEALRRAESEKRYSTAADKAYKSVEREDSLFKRFEGLFGGKTTPEEMLGVYRSLNRRQKDEATRLAKEVYAIARRDGRDEESLDRYYEATVLGTASRSRSAGRQQDVVEALRSAERERRSLEKKAEIVNKGFDQYLKSKAALDQAEETLRVLSAQDVKNIVNQGPEAVKRYRDAINAVEGRRKAVYGTQSRLVDPDNRLIGLRQELRETMGSTGLESARETYRRTISGRSPEQIAASGRSAITLANRSVQQLQAAIVQSKGKAAALLDQEYIDLVKFADAVNQARADLVRTDRQLGRASSSRADKFSDPARKVKAARLRLGRDAVRMYGSPETMPEELRLPAVDYLKARLAAANRAMVSKAERYGIDSPEVANGAKHLRELETQIHRTKDAAAHAHPILTQLGRVLGQFMRYSIGYAFLYKITEGLRSMATAAVDLQDKLKDIQAISGSTNTEMSGLEATIKQIATTSKFSLNDISDAVKVVAQAGTSLRDIPRTVKAVSDLATASGTSLQVAADIITTAQSVWDKTDPDQIANKVTQAANASKLSVESLQTIFSLGASFAKGANLSVDQYLSFVAAITNKGVRPSTVATGGGQLFKELFAPDDKFSQFLSQRYGAIGENMSAREARARFAGFTETGNPLQSVLSEMQRIGAGSAEAITSLRRAIDDRAFRVLQPLLNDPGALQRASAQIQAAPTAQEAARVAMDSLKKATDNLRDQFHSLADTLLKDALPALTQLVKATSKAVAAVEDAVKRAQDLVKAGASGGVSAWSATALGAAAGASRAPGLWKIPAAVAGGVGAGASALFANTVAINAGKSDTVTDAIGLAIDAFLLSKIKWVRNMIGRATAGVSGTVLNRGGAKALEQVGEQVVKSSTGIFAKIGQWISAKLGPKLALGAIPYVGAFIAAVSTLIDLVQLVGGLFSDEDKQKIDEMKRRRQMSSGDFMASVTEQQVKAEQNRETRFASEQPGQLLPEDSLLGQVKKRQAEREDFRRKVEEAIGVVVTDKNEDDLLAAFKQLAEQYPVDNELRKSQLESIQKRFGGVGPIESSNTYVASTAATTLSASVGEMISALSKERNDLRMRGRANLGDDREVKLFDAYEELTNLRPAVKNMLDGNQMSLEDTLAAVELFGKRAASVFDSAKGLFQQAGDQVLEAFTRGVDANRAGDSNRIETDAINLKKLVEDGISKYGYSFAESLQSRLPNSLEPAVQQTRSTAFDAASRAITARADQDIAKYKQLQAQLLDDAQVLQASPDQDKSKEIGLDGKPWSLSKQALFFGNEFLPDMISNLERLKQEAQGVISIRGDDVEKGNSFAKLLESVDIVSGQNTGFKPFVRRGDFIEDGRGGFDINPALGITETANQIRKKEDVPVVKKVYEGNLELSDQVQDLQRQINALRNPSPQELLGSGLLQKKFDAEKKLLEDEIGFLRQQPEDETGQKNKEINAKQNQIKDLETAFKREIADLEYRVALLTKTSEKEAIDKKIDVLRANQDSLTAVGRGEEFTSAQELAELEERRRKVAEDLLDLRRRNNEATKEEVEAVREKLTLEEQTRRLDAQYQNMEAQKSRILSGQNLGTSFREKQAYLQSIGAAQPVAEQAAGLSQQMRDLQGLASKQRTSIEEAAAQLAQVKPDDPGYAALVKSVEQTRASFADTSVQVVRLKAELEDLVPTIATEVSQFSAASIEAKISQLPQALKNLNVNLENRIVGAVDQLATALSDALSNSIAGLLGLGETSDEVTQAMSDLREAQMRLNDVVTGSLDVAEQISAIRQNETDPVRQEYLINRAMEAQRRSEALAQAEVDQAQERLDYEQANSGFLGSLRTIGSELFGGIGQDMFKAMFLDIFGNGARGLTRDKPTYVEVVNSSGTATTDTEGGVFSWVSGLFSDKVEGDSAVIQQQGQVAAKAADTVENASWSFDRTFTWVGDMFSNFFGPSGTVSGLFSNLITSLGSIFSAGSLMGSTGGGIGSMLGGIGSMLSGAWDGISGLFNKGVDAFGANASGRIVESVTGGGGGGYLGGIVGGLASIGTTLWNYFSSKDQPQVYVKQRAGGGYITGPGSSTSDSIPAMLSNGEYVLNAAAVRTIGKDTLDAWNTATARPARFAVGGMVGAAQRSVAAMQMPTPAAPPQEQGGGTQGVRVVLVDDQRKVKDYLTSSEGERTLVDVVRRNSLSLRQVLQGS